MAAGQAALKGAEVLVLEKMPRPALKLGITGKGRCNISNIATVDEFITHFGTNGRVLRQAFSRFFTQDLVDFLGSRGVLTITERGGRIFPASESALDVVHALVHWATAAGVKIHTGEKASHAQIQDDRIVGVQTDKNAYPADSVIIATGGASYPGTGSTGDGYRLAEEAGHRLIPIRPALIPLETVGELAPRLQGLSLKNVQASVFAGQKKVATEFGEMLFTHFGLSGPIILTLSGRVVDLLEEKQAVSVSIDLKPALDEVKLEARLLRDFDTFGKRQFHSYLKELLPAKMIPVCSDTLAIPADKPVSQLNSGERKRLRLWLKDLRFGIRSARPLKEAIITAGGVSTKEIDPRTMQSKIIRGLYFAGEVIDINADTGGYNLQAAFSTGWLAGNSCTG